MASFLCNIRLVLSLKCMILKVTNVKVHVKYIQNYLVHSNSANVTAVDGDNKGLFV